MKHAGLLARCPKLALLGLIIAGCEQSRSQQIILADDTGSLKLVYDCSAFRPQAESANDLRILALAVPATMRHATEHGNIITAQSLMNAYSQEKKDWRAIERIVIEYRCSHLADFSKQ